MSKKLFKRMIPDIKTIQQNKFLNLFGSVLQNPNLWHLSRYSAATAFSIALFCTFVPLPIHTLLALILAIGLNANIPICMVLLWINTPITYIPIFYFAFKVGSLILGSAPVGFDFEMSYQWITTELHEIWKPFLLGCFVCAVSFAILSNMIVRLLWRCSVSRSWKKRQQQLAQKNSSSP